jgi:hypothetical protein
MQSVAIRLLPFTPAQSQGLYHTVMILTNIPYESDLRGRKSDSRLVEHCSNRPLYGSCCLRVVCMQALISKSKTPVFVDCRIDTWSITLS